MNLENPLIFFKATIRYQYITNDLVDTVSNYHLFGLSRLNCIPWQSLRLVRQTV